MSGLADRKSFECYIRYMALKKHFSEKTYDYFKYNGKVRASFEKFVTRPDVYYFAKLSRKQEFIDILVANLSKDSSKWISDIVSYEGDAIYKKWLKTKESFSYCFENDIAKMKDDFRDNFTVCEGKIPYIIELFKAGDITPETFAIMISISKCKSIWEKSSSSYFLESEIMFAEKYLPFVSYDQKKIKTLMNNRW